MKLLLTSNGLCNKSITNALKELIDKPLPKSNLAFIPTAANVEEGDKWWLINDLQNCKNVGFQVVDIIDISALTREQWLPRLKSADVLLFGGGNTFHLIHWIRKSGLDKLLPNLLKTRVYVGISAGSMVTGPNIRLSESRKLYYLDIKNYQDDAGLGLVNFTIRPHLNNNYFPNVRKENLAKLTKEIPEPIYALDDESAIKVDGKKIQIVSEGQYLAFNT